jgi:ligand-binding sensor domain-containing protein
MAQHPVLRYALVLICVTTLTAFAEEPFRFQHLTLRDGLSNNSVYQMAQDSRGFMWLGTFSGLNRYDGNRIDIFRPEPMDPDSISGSVVFDIVEDSHGHVWIGTDGGGLNRYDVAADAFRSYLPDDTRPRSISSAKVFSVEEGRSGRIWVGTGDAGIAILNPEGGQFTNYRAAETPGLESDVIRVLHRDGDGDMWVGTQGGGLSLAEQTRAFRSFLSGMTVRDVFISADETVWVGLDQYGLLRLDGNKSEPVFTTVLDGISVRTINEDGAGRLWIGTERSGVAVVEPDGAVRWITNDPDDDTSLSSDFIRDIYVDVSDLVWIATRGGGVNIFNPRSTRFSRIIPGEEYSTRQMIEVADGTLWIATDGQGIYQRSPDGRITNLRSASDAGLSSDHLYALAEDPDGTIWAGSDGSGLDRIDTDSGEITNYHHDPQDGTSLSSDVIWSLLITTAGELWAGTEGGGLNRYDRVHDRFERFQNDPDRPDSLLGSSVRALYEDSAGTLWVGTWDGGLSYRIPGENRFVNYTRDPNDPHSISDPKTEQFEAFRVEDGLADDHVLGIVRDERGFLWVTTANGLSRFDLITREFTNYWDTDGLPANGFSRNAYLEMRDGAVLVGLSRGYVYRVFLRGSRLYRSGAEQVRGPTDRI